MCYQNVLCFDSFPYSFLITWEWHSDKRLSQERTDHLETMILKADSKAEPHCTSALPLSSPSSQHRPQNSSPPRKHIITVRNSHVTQVYKQKLDISNTSL